VDNIYSKHGAELMVLSGSSNYAVWSANEIFKEEKHRVPTMVLFGGGDTPGLFGVNFIRNDMVGGAVSAIPTSWNYVNTTFCGRSISFTGTPLTAGHYYACGWTANAEILSGVGGFTSGTTTIR
jgi:hypothetical protein